MKALLMRVCIISITVILFTVYHLSAETKRTLKGFVQDSNTQKAVIGALVLLAKKQGNDPVCVINNKLVSSTNKTGRFEFDNIPLGDYVVLYNLSGKIKEIWDGLKINYSPAESYPGYLGHIQKSLGVNIAILKGAKFKIVNGKVVATSGFFYAKELDFILIGINNELYTISVGETPKDLNLSVRTDIPMN
jgi:hypothetical protein